MENNAPPPQPPPPPPPRASGLPPGNYDIFVIPPHSSGSGFLYLPSLQPHRNSFIAGVACTLLVVSFCAMIIPVLRQLTANLATFNGLGLLLLILGVGAGGWAWGKVQASDTGWNGNRTPKPGAGGGARGPPPGSPPFTPPSYTKPSSSAGASEWEKRREETRKKEEERRKREEADKKTREAAAAAEKDKWDKARAAERVEREREMREKMEALRREKEVKEKMEKAKAAAAAGGRNYQKPTAQSWVGDDEPMPGRGHGMGQGSGSSAYSESSWAPSASTSSTTPPPSQRGAYATKNPEKIMIRAVYRFDDMGGGRPSAQVVSGRDRVTNGLVLRMTTEGLFIDDDIRGTPLREWDVKAWGLKTIEVSCSRLVREDRCVDGTRRANVWQTGQANGTHVLRAGVRDAQNSRYIFVVAGPESHKLALGMQRLRRGTQVRSLGVAGLSAKETQDLLQRTGWG